MIQRRKDGSENFNRLWADYEKGFGDLNGEFWYGLKAMHCLTQNSRWELRIEFEFKNKTRSYLHYNLGSASEEYSLTIGGFTGITPTDPFSTGNQIGTKFSTHDNDNWSENNCAHRRNGWWYSYCWHVNLNYDYNPVRYGSLYLARRWYNPRWIEMKVRPLDCTRQWIKAVASCNGNQTNLLQKFHKVCHLLIIAVFSKRVILTNLHLVYTK